MKLVLYGAPRTKKNHGFRTKQGHQMPSAAYSAWDRMAQLQIAKWRSERTSNRTFNCWIVPCNVKALFYRESLVGDAVGFYQALADTLEKGGIVENDSLIRSWDGSRLFKDKANPRIEIEITEFIE